VGSAIGKRIDAVLRVGLPSLLKEHGFKKQGRTWRRVRGDGTQIVSVQGSQWNAGDEGRLTVNLAAYYPAVAKLSRMAIKAAPGEIDGHIRVRIGQLMPGKRDFWWTIERGAAADLGDLGVDVAEKLHAHGLPFVDTAASLAEANERLCEPGAVWPTGGVLIAIAAGDLAGARRRCKAVLAELSPDATVAIAELERLQQRYL
jgi:hypothetical protein